MLSARAIHSCFGGHSYITRMLGTFSFYQEVRQTAIHMNVSGVIRTVLDRLYFLSRTSPKSLRTTLRIPCINSQINPGHTLESASPTVVMQGCEYNTSVGKSTHLISELFRFVRSCSRTASESSAVGSHGPKLLQSHACTFSSNTCQQQQHTHEMASCIPRKPAVFT